MNRRIFLLVIIVLGGGMMGIFAYIAGGIAQTVSYSAHAGPYPVEVLLQEWYDAKRDRMIPVKIYYPDGDQSFPVIIFSHGLGGSRRGYQYLGEHWASHGFVSVHIQHPGSDEALLENPVMARTKARKAAKDPQNLINRPKDVHFAIDELLQRNRNEESYLYGHIDPDRIGVAGHSFGAYTALVTAGRTFTDKQGHTIDLSDPRVKACLAMSPPARTLKEDRPTYATFNRPCFHMTGTRDDSPIGKTTAAQRRIPFDAISAPDQYLVTFTDGDHQIFSGRVTIRNPADRKDPIFQSYIKMASTAFWDAYLNQNEHAKQWLQGSFQKILGADGVFEQK